MESNTRKEMIFTVRHERKANGQIKQLDDPRDVYEMVANMGARRMRACIMAIIPGDVFDMAVEECQKTLAGSNDSPLKDRIVKMLDAFTSQGVTKEMIEKRLGHNIDATIESQFVELLSIYNSIKDGMSKRDDWFKMQAPKAGGLVEEMSDNPKEEEKPPTPEPSPEGKAEHMAKVNWNKLIEACKEAGVTFPQVEKWASAEGRNIDINTEEGARKVLIGWGDVVKELKGE